MSGSSAQKNEALAHFKSVRKRAGGMAESIFRALNIDENAEEILNMLRRERERDEKEGRPCTAGK